MKKTGFWLAGCFLGAACVSACGSSTTGTGGGSTTTTGGAGGSSAVEMCDPATTTLTSGNATITFPMGASPAQYSPNCVKIKAGSAVTWNGAFADHPLTADGSGPIMTTNMGTTVTFTFPTAGAFGFHCGFHQAIMHGAVFVE